MAESRVDLNVLHSAVPAEAQTHPDFQQLLALVGNSGMHTEAGAVQYNAILANILASLPQSGKGDALQEVGGIVKERLSQRTIDVNNPRTGQAETLAVPVKDVTVDTELSADPSGQNKQSMVFKIHVGHKDTVHQAQITDEAKQVLAEIHPLFKASEQNPAPVRAGSYRDDTHISLIADIPQGKDPAEIVAEILAAQKTSPEQPAPEAASGGFARKLATGETALERMENRPSASLAIGA